MKKNIVKSALVLMAVCVLGVTGCGSAKPTDVLSTINGEELTYATANFYLRTQQGYYETYYSSILGNDMWNQSLNDSITFGQSTTSSIVAELQEMVVLSQHADEYDIALSDEEKQAISEAADAFIEANDKKTIEVMTADKEAVEGYLSLTTVGRKVTAAIKSGADTEVSDEEAAQRGVEHTFFSTASTTDEAGKTIEPTEDRKAEILEAAQTLLNDVTGGADMTEAAEALGYKATLAAYSEDNTGSLNSAVIEEANKLSEGQVGDIVEVESGYYVVKLVSEFDKEATEERKTAIVGERQSNLYNEVVTAWKEESKIDVNSKVLSKLRIDGTVKIKDKAAEAVDDVVDQVEEALPNDETQDSKTTE